MHWPADHPLHTDDRLAPWRPHAEALCPDARVERVLKHVPGRRVATLLRTGGLPAVLKVFASPRARGNSRRLRALHAQLGDLVPEALRVDPEGHVGLLRYLPGTALDELSGEPFVTACRSAGAALARLHDCDVVLDRQWTADDELRQLRAGGTATTGTAVERAASRWRPDPRTRCVPSHRDLHPAQVVLHQGAVHLIDLDEAAMAPPGLDVGNFLGHLVLDEVVGRRRPEEVRAALEQFRQGYGRAPEDTEAWQQLTLTRLASLADARHRRPDWTEQILDVLV